MFRSSVRVCNHSFLPQLIDSKSVVVDLGAHDGDFAEEIIRIFGCRVLSAEPVRELLDRIQPHPLLSVLPVAVGGKNQPIAMNVFASRCASMLGPVSSSERPATQMVEMITLPEFMHRAGAQKVDLLKFDIEGAEIDVFDSCSDHLLQSIMQITVEFHDFLYPEQRADVARIRERMRDMGFWVLPFSLDNTDVLFLNKRSGIPAAEIMYLRTIVRYGKGLKRRLRAVTT